MVNNSYLRPVWAEIDLYNLRSNLQELQKCCPKSMIMAVVKANAYGHGSVECAKAALGAGATRLGVALVEEGIELRRAGIKAPIQILSEPPVDAISLILKYGLIPTVCSVDLALPLSIEAKKQGLTPKIHLKVDTGMRRLGVPAEEAQKMHKYLKGLPNIELEGIFTHLAVSEKPEDPFTDQQLSIFSEILDKIDDSSLIKHSANSGGVIFHSTSHLDMVRIGISMYGLYPSEEAKKRVDLKPVMALKARVTMVKDVRKGEGVSYGYTFIAEEDTKVAVIPIGYGDGYNRNLSNRGEIILRGRRAQVAGTVCMDLTMFDIGKNSKVKKNDIGVLIGASEDKNSKTKPARGSKKFFSKGAGGSELAEKGCSTPSITADDIATELGTINYEVVTGISKRVPRIFI